MVMDHNEWYQKMKAAGLQIFDFLSGKIHSILKLLLVNPRIRKAFHTINNYFVVSAFILGFIVFFIIIIPLLQELTLSLLPGTRINTAVRLSEKETDDQIRKLLKANLITENKLNRKIPYQSYLVVNSTENKFSMYSRRKLIREGKCSTGSYIMLQAADERRWIFKTPRGVFRIQGKITSPVWKKPDWAFIEEGLPVPSKSSYLRYEFGVLGDYAMSLGHGYLIHGTLYQRLLGMPVTHGCIRLGDDDLKAVYQNLNIGSKVFIY
jgi:hypothetical protein